MNKVLLFTTTWCTNCPPVKKRLDGLGITYQCVDAIQFPLVAKEYNIRAVPTVLITDDEGNEILYKVTGHAQDYNKIEELIDGV